MDAFINALFRFVVAWRNTIVRLFQIFYVLQLVFLYFEYRVFVLLQGNYDLFYSLGKKCAEAAIICFILTTIPGMARRYGISHKFISILMMFRRYIGIASFMFVINHLSAVWLFSSIGMGGFFLPTRGFEVFGLIAAVLLFFLFITSNDFSVKWLGDWWNKIHALTYVTMWIITLHVMFQGRLAWSALIGAASIAELASFISAKKRRTAIS
ncbi:MAG TPA: ferric reductase-like transmembrane domain-containing protein [Patescibacteria group bacterium]|nr:ferric reductase-like transmembrane domain-containing protein [Patescibacteria group bacterium]